MTEENKKSISFERQANLLVKYIGRDAMLSRQISRSLNSLTNIINRDKEPVTIPNSYHELILRETINEALKKWSNTGTYFQVDELIGISYFENGKKSQKSQTELLSLLKDKSETIGNVLEWHAFEFAFRNNNTNNEFLSSLKNEEHTELRDNTYLASPKRVAVNTLDHKTVMQFNDQLEYIFDLYRTDSNLRNLAMLYHTNTDDILSKLTRLAQGDDSISPQEAEDVLRDAINVAIRNQNHMNKNFNLEKDNIVHLIRQNENCYILGSHELFSFKRDKSEATNPVAFNILREKSLNEKDIGIASHALEWLKRNDNAIFRANVLGKTKKEIGTTGFDTKAYKYKPDLLKSDYEKVVKLR